MWAALLIVAGLAAGPEAAFDDDCAAVDSGAADKVLRVTVLLPSAAEVAGKADPHSIVYNNQLEKGFPFCCRSMCCSPDWTSVSSTWIIEKPFTLTFVSNRKLAF